MSSDSPRAVGQAATAREARESSPSVKPDLTFSPQAATQELGHFLLSVEQWLGGVIRFGQGTPPPQDRFKQLSDSQQRVYGEAMTQGAVMDATRAQTEWALKQDHHLYRNMLDELGTTLGNITAFRNLPIEDPETKRTVEAAARQAADDAINNFMRTVQVGVERIAREIDRPLHPSELPQELPPDTRTIFERLFGVEPDR